MTDWAADFRDKVKAGAGAAAGRVFTTRREPRTPLPAVVLHYISAPVDQRMDGPQALSQARVQVDCLATDAGQARAIAWAIKAAIPLTWEATANRFDKVSTSDPVSDGDQGETEYVHRARFDAMVWHAPTGG